MKIKKDLTVKDYPVFVIQYWTSHRNRNFAKMAENVADKCEDFGIPWVIANATDELDDFMDFMSHLDNVVRHRKQARFMPFNLRKIVTKIQRPIVHIHPDIIVKKKPPKEFFDGVSLGWAEGQCAPDSHYEHFMSTPVYINYDEIGRTYLDVVCYKCKHINLQESEHKFLSVTAKKDMFKSDRVMKFPDTMCSRVDNKDLYFYHKKG